MRTELRLGDYRPDLDGLRAISIVAVVLFHARVPGFAAGYLGVDVFFVISGFLITGQLLREAQATGTIRMGMFYARRVRRLIPAFLTMAVGASGLALVYLLPMTEQRLFGNALSRSALFYYNIAVWRGGYAYNGEPAEQQVLMHTWSLGVEEQFYLVWPLISLVAFRIGRPLAAYSIVVLASLIGNWWFLPRDRDAVFFLLPFRAWELALGACVAARWQSMPPRDVGSGAIAGVALILLALLAGQPHETTFWARSCVAIGAALVIAFGAAPNVASSLLRTRPMVYLGRMSYSWYLWHWPLLAIARLAEFPAAPGIPVGPLLSGFVLAALTYVWVEGPTRRIPIVRPFTTLAWGGGAIAITALAGAAIELRSRWSMLEPRSVARLASLASTPVRLCETQVALLGCDLSAKSGVAAPSLLLWGDSFARSLSPALSKYSRDVGSPVRLLAQAGCPPLLGAIPAGARDPSKPDGACRDFLEAVQKQLHSDPARIAGVILAGAWLRHVPGDASAKPPKMFDHHDQQLMGSHAALSQGLGETLDFLRSIGARALVIGAPPEFPFEVPRCLWRAPDRCLVDRSWKAAARAQVLSGLEGAIHSRQDVRYVDLFDTLCPGSQCRGGTLDVPLLTDRTHLSAAAARELVLPVLARDLDWLRGAAVRTEDGARSVAPRK